MTATRPIDPSPRPPFRGFTLIELLVVTALIVVLLALLIPALGYAHKKANYVRVTHQLAAIGQACEAYYSTFRAYPGLLSETNIAGVSGGGFSSSANLAVSLMGGLTTAGTIGSYSTAYVGRGPLVGATGATTTTGHLMSSFYSAKANELSQQGGNPWYVISDAVMGLPILYYRAQATAPGSPPVAESFGAGPSAAGTYIRNVNSTFSDGIVTGYGGKTYSQGGTLTLANLAGIVANQGTSSLTSPNDPTQSQATGGFALVAANQDGCYLSPTAAGQAGAANTANLTASGWTVFQKMLAPVYVGGKAP
jgi:prepilin-type N-terminal cleavage/methylation domain-containing protein